MVATGSTGSCCSSLEDNSCEKGYSNPTSAPSTVTAVQGGIIVLARVKPSPEDDFAQILLPLALSYETFVCKLCVALGIERSEVRKVKKLPDILIRSTEDVIRLNQLDKLEIRLKRKNFIAGKFKYFRGKISTFFPYVVFLACFVAIFRHQEQSAVLLTDLSSKIADLRREIGEDRKILKDLSSRQTPVRQSQGDFGAALANHRQSLESSWKTTEEVLQRKISALEKGVGMLAQRVKETKLLFKNGLEEFFEEYKQESNVYCKSKEKENR